MVLAEVFLSAFITVLFEKLASTDLWKLARSEGIDSQLKTWKSTLTQIGAVLSDAGQKQVTDKAVQLWLDDLQDLAYDMEDVLDDLATEVLLRKLTVESEASSSNNSKVWKFIPTCCTTVTPRTFMYGRTMTSKLEDINARLKHLVDIKNGLGLIVNSERPDKRSIREETTSLVDESGVFGRNSVKEVLLEKLLETEACNRNVCVVPIVGMGGIGKTTVAQLLYNDKKVKEHFELMAWVCVSDEFDVFKISKSIFQDVTGEDRKFETLNLLQVALQEKFSKKRFLLVLDDVWDNILGNWENLLLPSRVGSPGSKVIVTTRSHTVVSTVGDVQPCDLKVLSDDESLLLFARHALDDTDFDKYPTLKSYGIGIVGKCKGLPLALRTLGRALRPTKNDKDWEEILNSEIWMLEEGEHGILPALRLSYHHLPARLKKLFAYCCLFPKDYVFDKHELVLLWMAEGFLDESNGNKPMEDAGLKCFGELLSRSFFQHSPSDESRYVMHDLMNDLATSVAGALSFRLDEKMNAEERRPEALEKVRHFSFVRKKYGVYSKFEALHKAKRLRTFLPVSVLRLQPWERFHLSSKVLTELVPQLQLLRVLSLSRYSIKEVPECIGNLMHLRYLNFSYTEITCLPEQVCQLYNLHTLLMCRCEKLTKLPASFAKLKSLRHLDMSDTPKLENMPLGIGGLRSLRTLSKVIVGGADGFRITELKDLSDLQGRLSIMGLHKVVSAIQAKESNLLQKKDVDHLELGWSSMFDDSRKEAIEYEVFEALRPCNKLRKLEIACYGGNRFPNWIGDPSFDRLKELRLRGCRSCTSLPSVGHLPSLQRLYVEGMDALKIVGPEMLGTRNYSHAIAFPSLEVLELRNMQGWEKWSINVVVNDDVVGVFPRLRVLKISGCPNLVEVSVVFPSLEVLELSNMQGLGKWSINCGVNDDVAGVLFSRLRELRIEYCPNLVEVSVQSLPSLVVLDIGDCQQVVLRSVVEVTSCVRELRIRNVVGLTQLDGGMMEHLGAVEDLEIKFCKEVRYLWGSLAEACKILVKLRKLEVYRCPELVCLEEGNKEEGGNWREGISLTSLRHLSVSECGKMECLFKKGTEEEESDSRSSIFPHLEVLYFQGCSEMRSLSAMGGGQKLPSTLKRIAIMSCKNMLLEEEEPESVGGGGRENQNLNSKSSSLSSSLEYLYAFYWPNMKLFVERGRGFIHLTQLFIVGCEGIESFPRMTTTTTTKAGGGGGGFLPKGLRRLEISDCKNLKWFPDEELQSLTSLLDMSIYKCPSMDSAFPRGLWPPNLSRLSIGGLKKPISEWGLQNFPTSLVYLVLYGRVDEEVMVSFAEVDVMGIISTTTQTTTTTTTALLLPSSLSELYLCDLKNLETISKGLQHLTSLETLQIITCPNLRDLPDTLLHSLSSLSIINSPKLKEWCIRSNNRRDNSSSSSSYPLISAIPCLEIDYILSS